MHQQHKMLELERKAAELDEQIALAGAERERNAAAVARAVTTREQLASAHEELRKKDEQLSAIASERRGQS